MQTTSLQMMMRAALFAALSAILSQIILPIGPVPINLALFSVFLAGAMLGPTYGLMSQGIYVLLGAVGLPVFAGFKGGIGALLGPTGGYIIGYLFCVLLVGLFSRKQPQSLLIVGMVMGWVACLALGTMWFMVLTKNGLMTSLGLCVIPFIPGDVAKIALAYWVSRRLQKLGL